MNLMTRLATGLLLLCPLAGHAHDQREQRADREVREARDLERREAESRSDRSGSSGRSSEELRSDRRGEDGGKHGKQDDAREGSRESGGERHTRIEFDRDRHGHERMRAEVLVLGNTRELALVRGAGFQVLEEQTLSSADEVLARVRTNTPIERAIRELHLLVPAATVAPHHLYRPSAQVPAADGDAPAPPANSAHERPLELGIIDTGIATATSILERALMETRAFASGGYVPRTHGTVVGEVAASAGVTLSSADVFGVDTNDELAAPAVALAAAIDWMVTRGVRVLNISIEGPDNPVLARVIKRALAADVAIVAAAGNEGPHAAPVFPAAYPGVIAVTAVDENGRIYRRANRGQYIAFAARGVNVPSPLGKAGPVSFSGTSFATPLVAALLTLQRAAQPADPVDAAVLALRRSARDLGAPGRDDTFGWGELSIEPLRSTGAR